MRCGISISISLTFFRPFNLEAATATTTSISVSPTSQKFGQKVTISAAVTPSAATGSVTFYNGVSVIGIGTLASGHASAATEFLPCCSATLTARYNGSPSYAPSVSAPASENILISAMNGFARYSDYAAGANPSSIAVGDFNNDGVPDLVLTNVGEASELNGVSVLLGNPNGTFQTGKFYPAGGGAYAVAVGDFNGDGIPDLAVANTDDSLHSVSILLGLGNGTFSAPINSQFGDYYPSAIITGDFNGDGLLDVATANLGDGSQGSFTIFAGNGNGTLGTPVTNPVGAEAMALVAGDFNRDGNADLAIADPISNTVYILLGNGKGAFTSAAPISGLAAPSGIVAADFNADGKIDLATANADYLAPAGGNVAVLLGNGDGTFQNPRSSGPVLDGQGIAAGDLNGDGKIDLVVTTDAGVTILYGNGDGTLQTPSAPLATSASTLSSTAIALADFNGDSYPDIAVANYLDANAAVLFGQAGTCSYSLTPASSIYDANGGNFPLSVTANSPGCVWSATASPSLSLSPYSGTGTQSISVTALPNTTGQALTGTISIGGQSASVGEWETVQTFNDVPVSAYYFDAVNLLKNENITSGCGNNDYCPGLVVTRAQMAIFIVRAIIGSDNFTWSPTPHFNDVPPNAFGFAWIQKLFELNITSGCGGGDYCPDTSVTRDQMAVFVIRARFGAFTIFDFPPVPSFSDVPTNYWAFAWIQRMAVDSITGGCGSGDYCPTTAVSRADMALFLMRGAFNQLLPAGTPVITKISPATLTHGKSGTFTVTGQFTGFVQGSTSIKPVPGLQIGPATVTSAGTLSVQLTANTDAALQPVSLVAVTGTQEAILPNGLTIE